MVARYYCITSQKCPIVSSLGLYPSYTTTFFSSERSMVGDPHTRITTSSGLSMIRALEAQTE